MIRLLRSTVAITAFTGILVCPVVAQTNSKKPNIVLILADDMGYSDLGCYGSEINTPNLDMLAKNGVRFTQFYNTARCWPSRAAILTGYYAQQVRRDVIPGVLNNGMQGKRPDWAPLLPVLLKPAGYRTYHSGKWHIDGKPLQNGFDRSYWLADTDRHFNPEEHYEDDQKLPPVPRNTGYYSTTAITSHAIKCITEHSKTNPDAPFFSYVAYVCPHFPLMAPADDIAKYKGRFDAGWDRLRLERLARMKKLRVLNSELSARTPGVPAWDTLTTEQHSVWSDRMAVHAAMIDRMDQEIGRLIQTLKKNGQYDNTVIMFLSDNGASAEKLVRGDGNLATAPAGSAESFLCLEPGWANLANSPLRLSKMFVHEGGISTPLIVEWPKHLIKNSQRNEPAHIIDISPTILDLAGASSQPRENAPLKPGISLVRELTSKETVKHDVLWWYHEGNRAIRVGDYKLVAKGAKGSWELYNIRLDRAEMHDLSGKMPEKAKELSDIWQKKMDEFIADARRP